MALLFCDSFDHYDFPRIDLKWTAHNAGAISSGNGRGGTDCFRTDRTDRYIRKTLAASYATLIVGFAFKENLIVDRSVILSFTDATANQVFLDTDATGRLRIRRGTVAAPTTLGTGTQILSNGVYYYIEVKVTIHPSAGVAIVKINGVTDINVSGANTRATANSTTDGIDLGNDQGQLATGFNKDYDDLVVLDTSGGAPNNDFLGDVRVQACYPDGAGASSQFTPSAGSNWQNVDETPPNDDTDYNSDSTAGHRDTYTFTNLIPTTGTVYGVQVLMFARKDDAGVRTIAPVVRHGGVNYDGTSVNIGSTYTYYVQMYEQNPGTAAAWTVTDVNGDEFGIKLVA